MMSDAFREAQKLATKLKNLDKAEAKLLNAVKARYETRRAEARKAAGAAAVNLLEIAEDKS